MSMLAFGWQSRASNRSLPDRAATQAELALVLETFTQDSVAKAAHICLKMTQFKRTIPICEIVQVISRALYGVPVLHKAQRIALDAFATLEIGLRDGNGPAVEDALARGDLKIADKERGTSLRAELDFEV